MFHDFLKFIVRHVLKFLYKIDIQGLENFEKAGNRVLVIANHTSLLDAVILVLFLPRRLAYAINTHVSKKWWVRPFLRFVDFCPMDPTNPLSLKTLINYLQEDRTVVIFPEGRMTVTGSMMKIYKGPGLVAEKTDATLLPVYIDGAQYSPFSKMKGISRIRLFPKITISIMEPVKLKFEEGMTGHDKREDAVRQMEDLMADMMFRASEYRHTILDEFLKARKIHGGKVEIMEDHKRQPLTYNQAIMRSILLGRLIARKTDYSENTGIMLPTSNAAVLLMLAMHFEGRVPTMLNFGSGQKAMENAVETSCLKKVFTSREFIKVAKLEKVVEGLANKVEILYLEDLKPEISIMDKLVGLFYSRFGTRRYYRKRGGKRSSDDAAVILFTSGTEGMPKGVVLSHENLLSNYYQICCRMPFNRKDVLLNVLPIFHSFGLMAGVFLPLFAGMKAFLYPSPLHYRIIPEIAYDIKATILFGSNTFLNGYAKHAHPYDFFTMRYVVAGAEALTEKTRMLWYEKFGVRIYQGYGATETSPVLSVNTPMHYRAGSVGRFLPGIEYYLHPVEGISDGQRLQVKGPNIMKGYMFHDNPGVIVPPEAEAGKGWYDMGDIVSIDDDGYMYIRGRAKRFAKIGGEMVSLSAVEELASRAWPNLNHGAVIVPDKKKGEQIILYTEQADANRKDLVKQAKTDGLNELLIPRQVISLDHMPVLATGKINFNELMEIHQKSQ